MRAMMLAPKSGVVCSLPPDSPEPRRTPRPKKIDTITGIMRGIFANFLRGDGVPGNDEDGSISDSSGSICPSTQSSIRWQLEVCGELRLNDCHGMARRHVLALLACCSQHTSILLLPTHTGRTKPLCVLKSIKNGRRQETDGGQTNNFGCATLWRYAGQGFAERVLRKLLMRLTVPPTVG